MLIKKEQAIKKQNTEDCIVFEYEYPSTNSSFAISKIEGRYPEKGKSKNLECEQAYYVISGSGTIYSEKGNFEIEKGDLYYFTKEEAYHVIGKNLEVCILNSPKWNLEQYILIEE